MSETNHTTDRKNDERREQIKKAALKVFASRGIAGTKISMIAAEAQISQGLTYRYFQSKEELFTLLVQEAVEEAQTSIRNVPLLPGTPLEQFKALTWNMLDDTNKHYFLLIQQAQTAEGVPEQAKLAISRYHPQDTMDLLVPIFEKGQQLGEFGEGDPRQMLFLYFSVVTGLMIQDTQGSMGSWQREVNRLIKLLT
ncbi:TetR/AcrR family transcriptional regulator [Paenibacillus chondroitinus]|uniref:TetR/AcrR family transcriptional regulator n=1 Tax=Paenibacillus chondroitinus TaxID=59842 RepID=A0ABU6DF29_9BACL|nr:MULTISPECIES: TetR/AcrR family transcriptional regulator [Paenibacillus]MCY9659306.1 TetR/AcrR family transcriptional regulator [Paenibacillus anseongense]MEB4796358.1 TetR/AcrR family transcriptional regulator [Paenibacillus chondroitinus]